MALDRLFAPVPNSSDLAERHAERERRLAEQGRRLDWAALEQMRAVGRWGMTELTSGL